MTSLPIVKPGGRLSGFGDKYFRHGQPDATPIAEESGHHANHKMGNHSSSEEKKPEGGHDPTPLPPSEEETYIIKVTFHRATRLPPADLSLTTDPYVLAELRTPSIAPRNHGEPRLAFRGHTERSTREPTWEDYWIIGGVPRAGGSLKVTIWDEDYNSKDDRLGHYHCELKDVGGSTWTDIKHQRFELKKRHAGKRVNLARALTTTLNPKRMFEDKRRGVEDEVEMSVEIIGTLKPGDERNVGRAFTMGPGKWTQHFSPVLGRITGTQGGSEEEDDKEQHRADGKSKNGKNDVKRYDFQANQIQLQGPTPSELYHRYVDFKWFVSGLFNSKGLAGWAMHRALKRQHGRIYAYDKHCKAGLFEHSYDDNPGQEVTRKFLELAHWDQGGRVFTFVLTLDAIFRFTETGPEFSIDLLSKHACHSDVALYVAWAGEFLVRRKANDGSSNTHPPSHLPGGPPDSPPPRDPSSYELVIDNNSGTYRPDASLLATFKHYLEENLPGLNITVLDCGKDGAKLKELHKAQEAAKKEEGAGISYMQRDDSDNSSISSSDISDMDEIQANGGETGSGHRGKLDKGFGFMESPRAEIHAAAGNRSGLH